MLTHPFKIRSRRIVHLGPVSVDVRSNEPDFAGFRFFVRSGDADVADHTSSNFTLSLCNLRLDGPWPEDTLASDQDRSYRARKFSAGYYLTDHFGAPAYLISRGSHYWLYAQDFEPILWPYAIKHLLTVYSMEHSMLHLKAAAVAVQGHATLLIGRGGSGKTVLLNRLCRNGAYFLSNTHTLLEESTAWGIPTAMRVRQDEFFAPLIQENRLPASVKAGEYTLDPLTDLGWKSARSAPVKTILLLDYKEPNSRTIHALSPQTMFDYMEQFSLAVNVYGLKEDILDHLDGDVVRFAADATRVRTGLQNLVEGSRCYYVSCDVAHEETVKAVFALLSEPALLN